MSATVARLILAKMWLMVHHPRSLNFTRGGPPLPPETKDRLFITSVEVIEFSYLLEKNENTAKWGWLFRTYMQWQSVAFVLSEICQRPPGPEIDRAWRAVEQVYIGKYSNTQTNHKGMLWKPMRHLMARAKAVQAKHLKDAGIAQPQNVEVQAPQATAEHDMWEFNYPGTFVSAPADALDIDLSGVEFSPQGSDQSGAPNLPARNMSMPQPTTSDAQMTGIPMPQELDMTNPDFLHWNGWTPGVGDFNVAPEPILQYFNNVQQEWF